MNHKTFFATVVILPILMSGCATLNEEQCQVTNWRDLGTADGLRGSGPSYISAHQEACTKFGIVPDQTSWLAGWETGIRQHCTAQNGLNRGRDGNFSASSCPSELAGAYNDGHRVGKKVFDARRSRDQLQREIDSDIKALAEADEERRAAIQVRLELKRNRLFILQSDLTRAEREADLFSLRVSSNRF